MIICLLFEVWCFTQRKDEYKFRIKYKVRTGVCRVQKETTNLMLSKDKIHLKSIIISLCLISYSYSKLGFLDFVHCRIMVCLNLSVFFVVFFTIL